MPRFVVRLGYDWVVPTFRDVTVKARDESEAEGKALDLSRKDPTFWCRRVRR